MTNDGNNVWRPINNTAELLTFRSNRGRLSIHKTNLFRYEKSSCKQHVSFKNVSSFGKCSANAYVCAILHNFYIQSVAISESSKWRYAKGE